MLNRILLAAAVLAAPAVAQAVRTVPVGFEKKWGGVPFYHWASAAGRTMQVVDNSNTTPFAAIKQLSFRRHNATSSGTPGTADVEVTMSQANWGMLDTRFAEQEKARNAKVVCKMKQINLPDWTAMPKDMSFDFPIKFDAPWVYLGRGLPGTEALVWTVRYKNSTAGTHVLDRAFGAYKYTAGTVIGSGCSGYSHYLRFWNTGPHSANDGMHMEVAGASGPKSSPTLMFFDLKDAQMTVPGLCSTLHALPVVVFPVGGTDAMGVLSHRYLQLPYIQGIEGWTIFTQLLSLDTTQTGLPFSVSNANTLTIPVNASVKGDSACYAWAQGVGATTAIGNFWFFSGAPVTELSQ